MYRAMLSATLRLSITAIPALKLEFKRIVNNFEQGGGAPQQKRRNGCCKRALNDSLLGNYTEPLVAFGPFMREQMRVHR